MSEEYDAGQKHDMGDWVRGWEQFQENKLAEATALNLIRLQMRRADVADADSIAADASRLAKLRNIPVDRVLDWIEETPWPLSILDFPRV